LAALVSVLKDWEGFGQAKKATVAVAETGTKTVVKATRKKMAE
jgi:hypothetical protein